jgi:hypothetical protein
MPTKSGKPVEPLQIVEGHWYFLNGEPLMDVAFDHARSGMSHRAEDERGLVARDGAVERRGRTGPGIRR